MYIVVALEWQEFCGFRVSRINIKIFLLVSALEINICYYIGPMLYHHYISKWKSVSTFLHLKLYIGM